MAKSKSVYSGSHGVMLGLLAFAGLVIVLRKQAEREASERPIEQLPG